MLTAVSAWEAQNLRALREQEARALQELEQEQLLTYTREDAYNSVRTCHVSPRRSAGSCPQEPLPRATVQCFGPTWPFPGGATWEVPHPEREELWRQLVA